MTSGNDHFTEREAKAQETASQDRSKETQNSVWAEEQRQEKPEVSAGRGTAPGKPEVSAGRGTAPGKPEVSVTAQGHEG